MLNCLNKSDPFTLVWDGNSPYYNIELKEIHVAGKTLPLNPRVFDGKYGAVLDSGTTYAYLPQPAFVAFRDAVSTFHFLCPFFFLMYFDIL